MRGTLTHPAKGLCPSAHPLISSLGRIRPGLHSHHNLLQVAYLRRRVLARELPVASVGLQVNGKSWAMLVLRSPRRQ